MKYLLALFALLMAPACFGQAWSGVLSSGRAINWSNAGIPGGLPDSGWSYCNATPLAPQGSSGTPADPNASGGINSLIAACSPNTKFQLASGNFYYNGNTIELVNQVALVAASGATVTIHEIGSSPSETCNGYYTAVGLCGSNSYPGGEQNYSTITFSSGTTPGTTSVTSSNSLNIVAGSTIITIDQLDPSTDTGNIWNCVNAGVCSLEGQGGFSRTDHNCATGSGICSQAQTFLVTACSPSCNNSGSTVLTLSPGLYMPNWSPSLSPGAYWATTTAYRMGVENINFDLSSFTGGGAAVATNCYECWVSGISSNDAARNAIWLHECEHCTVQNNYIYQAQTHGSSSYGIEVSTGGDNSIINNICQQITQGCPNYTGSTEGDVDAYNYAPDQLGGAGYFSQSTPFEHSSGTAMLLHEGNIGAMNSDDIHGTHHFGTVFRNIFTGWQANCNGSACSNPLYPIWYNVGTRYFNIVGNVLGQPGFSSTYSCTSPSSCSGNPIYDIGYQSGTYTGYCSNSSCSSYGTNDPLTANSLMLWGNYDVVNAATRFNTSEDASAFADTTGTPSTYAGLSSPSSTLANSWFATATTTSGCGTGLSWWKNPTLGTCEPFPPAGPDVTGGSLGVCSGGTYSGALATKSSDCTGGTLATYAGGHANSIPALDCYLHVMNGPPDGSGSQLTFSANACYANDPLISSTSSTMRGLNSFKGATAH